MALQVGELNALLTVDDRAVDPALRRAEQALRRSGQTMGGDADRAGQRAGQQLGEGLVRGADGQWRNMRGELVDAATAAIAEAEAIMRRGGQRMGAAVVAGGRQAGDDLGDGIVRGADGRLRDARGRFVSAGRRAGDAAGDGLADGLADGADEGVSAAGTKLEKLKQLAKGAALAAGAAAGALLMSAFGDAMDQSRIVGRLGAQLGKTPAEAKKFGKIAGQLYADAVTEDFQGAADAIRATMSSGLLPPAATNQQIREISTQVSDLASTFELDLGQAANAAGQMIKTGLAKNSRQALDIMAKGLQGLGPRADDLADTFNEYSTIFRNVGLDGQTAMGLIRQGMLAGARDTDVVADSIKEFTIEAVAGGERVKKGFTSLGLSADDMVAKFAAGGPTAAAAFDTVLDKLRGIEDPAKRNAVAIELFGTKAEDMGDALFALDPSEAVKTLGAVGGAANRMGDTLRDNAGTRLEQFKRRFKQGLVDFLGGSVLGSFEQIKTKLGGLWAEATSGLDGASIGTKVAAFIPMLGDAIVSKAAELGPKIAQALAMAGSRAAEWVMANPAETFKILAIAGAFLLALAFLPELLIAGVAATVGLIIGGFVARLIQAAQEKLPEWGNAISAWFGGLWSTYVSGPVSRTWNSFISTVKGLPGRTVGALAALGSYLASAAARHWQSFRNATAQKVVSFIGYVKGLPGSISRAIGSLSSLLTQKGRNVVQGLWSGIQGMGGWIKSKLISWAKNMIPGPIAKALGIASPSKVTAAQGKWIARGLIDGLTGSSKQVRAASYKLVDIVRDALTGKKEKAALKRINKDAGWLDWLAKRDAQVTSQLKTAKKKLDDLVKARDKLSADVKNGILGDADITKQADGGFQTADNILMNLREDTRAAQEFAKHLDTLKKKGVRSDLIAQIAQAGVSQGAASAAALANASSSQIKAINSQQAALTSAAGKAGSTAGNAMYGAGIQAAQGLVKGLQKEQKTIENTMLKMAKSMTAAIKKALGIKSPSRVMAQVGAYTAQGVLKGIEGERSAVNASMASLVETPTPSAAYAKSALGPGGRRGRSASAIPTVRLTAGDAFGDMVFSTIRQRVGVNGGDVQLVLGKGGR
ncbi:phage tail tape measure protein [Streptomyces tendae]|uniref:phage tail tape measure protein n=1 Tax=Streptomyces tendae TaxID=1932 RepID=UPI0037F49E4E